ncbi:MAG: hypothetical protein MRJ66_07610 [Nitrospira sp.]|nr:hypothetical protein [Nitrospira sp.]
MEEVQTASGPFKDALVRAYRNMERQAARSTSVLLKDLNFPRVGKEFRLALDGLVRPTVP